MYDLFHMPNTKPRSPPITAHITVQGIPLEMEVDTGASASIISEELFNNLWTEDIRPKLNPHTDILRRYTGETFETKGLIEVNVQHNEQKKTLNLLVVPGKGPALLGRDWLSQLKLNWQEIHAVKTTETVAITELIHKYNDVFKDELGTLKDVQVKFDIKDTVVHKFHKARPVPYAIKDMVSHELDRLENLGIYNQ